MEYVEGHRLSESISSRGLDLAAVDVMTWQTAAVFLPALIAFLVMLYVWATRGRDPKPGSVPAQYEPPSGLSPAEVGLLIDNSVDAPLIP